MSRRRQRILAALLLSTTSACVSAQPVALWALRVGGIPGAPAEVPVDALVLNPATQWWEWSLPPSDYFDGDGNLLMRVELLRIAYSMWGEIEIEFSILAGINDVGLGLWSGETEVPSGVISTSFECVLSNRTSPIAELTPTLRDWQTGEYYCYRAIHFYDTSWAYLVQSAATESELHIFEHAGPFDEGLPFSRLMSMHGFKLSAGDHLYGRSLHVPEPAPAASAALFALLSVALARRRG